LPFALSISVCVFFFLYLQFGLVEYKDITHSTL
jgi:hypothetical protein